jgi:hypothetical protein
VVYIVDILVVNYVNELKTFVDLNRKYVNPMLLYFQLKELKVPLDHMRDLIDFYKKKLVLQAFPVEHARVKQLKHLKL